MKNFDKYSTRSPDYHYRQVNRKSLTEYNAAVDARFEALVETVVRVGRGQKLRILDIGCGDGVALWLISKRLPNLELSGVEPVSAALAIAKSRVPHAILEEGSAEKLPFPDGFFDIVISSDVIEHVDNPDTMLQEAARVAKDGATIIIGTPVRHSKTPLDHNHVQEFFAEDFLEMMGRHFQDAELHESHNLVPTLLYNAPTKSFLNFRYAINLLALGGWNPFLAERKNASQMFAYMYTICRK